MLVSSLTRQLWQRRNRGLFNTSSGKKLVSEGEGGEGYRPAGSGGLANLYREKLAKYDRRFHLTLPGETGPLVSRLQSFGNLWGLVVGPWGDSSRDLHHLIRVLGEQRVLMRARSSGVSRGEEYLGVIVSQIRRVLSCAFVRAQALCLLARLPQLGPHARDASQRRNVAQQASAARRGEAEAIWRAHH